MDERCRLVIDHRDEYGLNMCCTVLSVTKSSVAWRERHRDDGADKALHAAIIQVIKDHPGYGWRRIKPELEDRLGHVVNHKRLKRLMRDTNLGLARCLPRVRHNGVRRILESKRGKLNLVRNVQLRPLAAVSTDFTEIQYGQGRKAWLMVTIDIISKVVLGWSLGPTRNRELALDCWDKTCATLNALGVGPGGLIVHSDLDAVYTSYAWLSAVLLKSQARLSFSEHGAKHNPWVESFWGRLKTEIGSQFTDATDIAELQDVITTEINYYNHARRHSALGYITPAAWLEIATQMLLPRPVLKCNTQPQPEEDNAWPF